jgi:lipopolysaccharide export LptBFGC system permease protein LptF
MQLSDIIQILAIPIECAIAGIAVLIAVRNKKVYGWFIAATFALFVLFDICRIFAVAISPEIHALVFFIACALMLCGIWLLYKKK